MVLKCRTMHAADLTADLVDGVASDANFIDFFSKLVV
jgi:hypothetical protein